MSQISPNVMWQIRTMVRCAVFAAVVALVLVPLAWTRAALVVPGLSPLVGIATLLATKNLGFASLFWLPVLIVAFFRRRWFCRWGCPVGLMTEYVGKASPASPARCKPVPKLGVWLALLSLSAAAVGCPLLLWLDPLAIFSGTLGLAVNLSAAAAQAAAGVLIAILVVSFLLPGAWCLKLCPLGATQELAAAPYVAVRRRENSCPANDAVDDELVSEPLNRRSLLTMAVGATCAAVGVPVGLVARSSAEGTESAILRPPGAAPEWQVGQLCVRCGNCVRACPSQIITTRWLSNIRSNWLVPEVAFDNDYCREKCTKCMEVCPSGALKLPNDSGSEKLAIGLAHLLMDRCLLVLGRECRTMCLESCPYEAITLKEWTWEDDRRYPIIASDKCPGCGACQVACTPMDAILVRAAAAKQDEPT